MRIIGFFINRETGGDTDRTTGEKDYNRAYGANVNFVFYRYRNIGGLVRKSEAPGIRGDSLTTLGGVEWQDDFVDAAIT